LKFRKIIGFGDSFAWGDELLSPGISDVSCIDNRAYRESHTYTALVADHFCVPYEIHAFPGGSCISTRSIYSWWFNQEPDPSGCLILAQLSGPWRTSQFDLRRNPSTEDYAWNRFIHSAWHEHYEQHDSLARDYFRNESALTDCRYWHDMIQLETYLFFHGQSFLTAGLLQFNSQVWNRQHRFVPDTLLWKGLPISLVLTEPDCFAPQGHLNEYGHRQLADLLISQIDHAIVTGC